MIVLGFLASNWPWLLLSLIPSILTLESACHRNEKWTLGPNYPTRRCLPRHPASTRLHPQVCLSPNLTPAACAEDSKGSKGAEVSLALSTVPTEGSSASTIVMFNKGFSRYSSFRQPITPVCALTHPCPHPTAYPTCIPCSACCLEPSVWHFKDRILPVPQFLCIPVSSAPLS